MRVAVAKLRDGWAVLEGQEALVRGLREKTDAHKIRYDLERKGFFQGEVVFARSGHRMVITVPVDHGSDAAQYDAYGRPTDMPRERDASGRFRRKPSDDEGSVDDL